MSVRMNAGEQGARYPCTVFVQLILGQAETKNRWRQADHGERILGHTSSSCTGFASPAARVAQSRFIKSAHASGGPNQERRYRCCNCINSSVRFTARSRSEEACL